MDENKSQRRTFLLTILSWVSGGFVLFLIYGGLRFLLSPLRRVTRGRAAIRVAALDDLPEDVPLRVVVQSDRRDAYVHYPPGPIGSVWLSRVPSDQGSPSVRCFQTKCPHLGCAVDYSKDRDRFFCPCHVSEFARDGTRVLGPTPRGMDELKATLTDPDSDGKRWVEVEYLEFQTGVAEKRIVS